MDSEYCEELKPSKEDKTKKLWKRNDTATKLLEWKVCYDAGAVTLHSSLFYL